MKLKSSNKFPILFLISVLGLVIFFSYLSPNKKESKYPDVPEFKQKTTLDFIQISLKEKYYNKLKEKRDRALRVRVLETNDKDYVPATIIFNGQPYKADIRLKGDWTDHLKGDKWSFRVKLKGDKTIFGMRKFSIHHPKTRGYINEWLYHKTIKSEGLIGLRYGFLEGAMHIKRDNSSTFINKELGVYAIEETFDKRTIENNGRKESVILKYNENLWWDGVKKSFAVSSPSGLNWSKFNKSVRYPITVFSEENVLKDSIMRNNFKLGKYLLRNAGASIAISEAFDAKKLAMQNAILNLFGGSHGNAIINLRIYYNPITSKLEPVAFDGDSGVKLRKYEHYNFAKKAKEDSLYTKELISALTKVSASEYLNNLIRTHENQISEFSKILKTEFNVSGFSPDNLEYNQGIIIEELKRLNPNYKESEVKNNHKIITKITLPDLAKWTLNEITTKKQREKQKGNDIYSFIRKSKTKPSYISLNKFAVKRGKKYQFSVLVKKEPNTSQFGYRIQTNYPNRVDVVFDIKKETVMGIYRTENFENVNASIEPYEGDWFKCTITTKIYSDNIRVIFGPTNNERSIGVWEASVKKEVKLSLVPSSLVVEEIED